MTVLRSGSFTDVGRVRNTNQDLALETANLFAVADGMGGHAGGEVASRVAVDALREAFDHRPTGEGLVDAVAAANAAVWNEGREQSDLRGMGTTLTAAALVAGRDGRDAVALANVGDSRAYVFGDGQLAQITSDHSLAEERVRQGAMTEQEAAVHPQRHILTRALGIGPGVEVDLWELHLRTGDRLLLCSDGLTNEVPDAEIAQLLSEPLDPSDAARRLVDTANEHGGNDNITVVVIDVVIGEDTGKRSPVELPATVAAKAAAAAGAGTPAGPVARLDEAGAAAEARGGSQGSSSGSAGARSCALPSSPAGPRGTSTAVVDPPTAARTVMVPGSPAGRVSKREAGRRRRHGQPRRVTVRVALFVLLLGAVIAGAYLIVRWYATDSYYVGVDRGQLTIYQGRSGGVLWFKPRLVERTGITISQVPQIDVPTVRGTVSEANLPAARRYVQNLRQEAIAEHRVPGGGGSSSGGTATGGSASTSVPPPPAPSTTAAP